MTNEWLTGLALMHVYRHMNFNVDEIIDNFARAYQGLCASSTLFLQMNRFRLRLCIAFFS